MSLAPIHTERQTEPTLLLIQEACVYAIMQRYYRTSRNAKAKADALAENCCSLNWQMLKLMH
jgi:hypothetical protein